MLFMAGAMIAEFLVEQSDRSGIDDLVKTNIVG
jgi:hypothetical protein